MGSREVTGGWKEVVIRDSFIVSPIEALPKEYQTEVKNNIGQYNFMVFPMLQENRPEDEYVFLPDFLTNQPLHIFCNMIKNFDENEITFSDAIKADRERARAELIQKRENRAPDKEIEDAQMFLQNLDVVEGVFTNGKEEKLLEDVEHLVIPEMKDGDDVASEKGVKFFSYKYDGFRPTY